MCDCHVELNLLLTYSALYHIMKICTSKGMESTWRRYPLKVPWFSRSLKSASGIERENPQPDQRSVGTRDSPPGFVWIATYTSDKQHQLQLLLKTCNKRT